ncbi:MAG: tyrosine-type recombinase/integrase [Verrucomicrobiota bacterium]
MRAQKRGKKGTVHVYQPAGSATYWLRYTVNGKRTRQNTGKPTEAEARIFAAQVGRMVGLANSDNLDDKRRLLEIARELLRALPELETEAAHLTAGKNLPTVREWFTRELDALRQNTSGDDRELTAKSITRMSQVVKDFLAYLKGQAVDLAAAPLNRLGPDDIKGFLTDLKTKGYSGVSRLYARDRIRAMLGHATDKGLLPVNPASVKQVGRLKFDTTSIRQPFNEKQLAAVLAAAEAAPKPWLYLAAMLGVFTGQRAGDVCAMRWEEIKDFDGPLPTIALKQQKSGNALVIPIAEPLRRALRAVPKEKRTGFFVGQEIGESYATGHTRRFGAGWRNLLDSLDLAGMVDVPTLARVAGTGTHGRARNAWSYHSFRHTCASHLSGPDAHYLLGHRFDEEKQLGITAQYRHEDLRRLKKQLDAIPYTAPANVVQLQEAATA